MKYQETYEQVPLKDFTEKAYLDYSMYVILDRALPHIGDGLKPVQRRIVYAMSELGLSALAKYKKSARTVGDVIGKFHPHGDSASYEAMVLMAQPFSYRYCLVDGQGNWGSADDPKSFAAMRYTEARLTAYSQTLLSELEQGTVDWTNNFDGTLKEPTLLPARVPNILLNGTMGIAVGMTTDIPPHNLNEVVSACIHLIENPDAGVEDLCRYIKGPDYPTEAEIISSPEDILKLYQEGVGSIRMRACFELENGNVVITGLPHQVSGAKLLEQIAAQMQAKKLPMIEDLRDESDHQNPTRLIIMPRSKRVDIDELMLHLFATTDLEKTYRVNLNMIGLNGKPRVRNLREILSEWLEFRTETVRRRLKFRLDKVLARLHILDGLLIAYLNIDEIIAIVRHEGEPKLVLMQRFSLTDEQADAILDLKLRHLARLEEMKIRGEQQALQQERAALEKILASNRRLISLIQSELREDAKKYGDARQSPIVERQASSALGAASLIVSETLTIVLSEKGWVRAAKGTEVDPTGLAFRSGDAYLSSAQGRTNQPVYIFDSSGRVYTLPAHELPSARSLGEPLTGRLNPPTGASFRAILAGSTEDQYVFASDAGYGFVVQLNDLNTKIRAGKAVLTVPAGAQALAPMKVFQLQTDLLAVVTAQGRLLLFPTKEIPILSRGKGNKLIQINSAEIKSRDDYVVSVVSIPADGSLKLNSGKRHLTMKPSDFVNYLGSRARRGQFLPRGFRRVEKLEVV